MLGLWGAGKGQGAEDAHVAGAGPCREQKQGHELGRLLCFHQSMLGPLTGNQQVRERGHEGSLGSHKFFFYLDYDGYKTGCTCLDLEHYITKELCFAIM